jgi:hypothetical protein
MDTTTIVMLVAGVVLMFVGVIVLREKKEGHSNS